ncbi:phosphatidylserine decarboxylase-domain-containing protein [Trametes polyzona]|nr:phosphatidylserine decarboxylase-domain-containing protein [Trametes polyzona]
MEYKRTRVSQALGQPHAIDHKRCGGNHSRRGGLHGRVGDDSRAGEYKGIYFTPSSRQDSATLAQRFTSISPPSSSQPCNIVPLSVMSSSRIVQQLRDRIDQDSEFKEDFEKAIVEVKAYNLPEFDNIKTLDDYLTYCESYLRWVPRENSDGTSIFAHICRLYFVLNQPSMVGYQSQISPDTYPPYTWLSEWLIQYAKEMGRWMDSPESINEESIRTFYNTPSYHMEDYVRAHWRTFNEFFARDIKKSVRPIDAPSDSRIIVHPADAVFNGSWPVDDSANCFFVKGIPWNISQLLDDDEDDASGANYGSRFAGGNFCHSILFPNDYHHVHAPVSGRVIEARVIEGLCYCYLEVETIPGYGRPRLTMRRSMQPGRSSSADDETPNTSGYQFLQARGLVIIDSPDLGHVAVLPIGMAQVSSIVLNVEVGDHVRKGEEIGYFQLGGSDVVMVFEAKANVNFTAKEKGKYNFGRRIATAAPARR